MGPRFMILDYSRNLIFRWLNVAEVCAIAKTLIVAPNPSFDIVNSNHQFVTADFVENSDKSWRFDPRPQAMVAEVSE